MSGSIKQLGNVLEPQLAAMLTQVVAVEPLAGTDEYGQPVYGPAQPWACLSFALPDRTLGKDGPVIIDWSLLIFPPDAPVTVNCQLTLPDGSSPPVLGVETLFDERGTHHLEVYTGHQPSVFGIFS
jgi:hypothetical protein